MRLERLLVLSLIFGSNFSALESVRARLKKVRPSFSESDFNSSYYTQPFELCKLSKKMNPVEEVRAQAFATRVFAKCGSSTVIKHAVAMQMPASGLQGFAKLLCLGAVAAYAHTANDGGSVLRNKGQIKDVFQLFDLYYASFRRVGYTFRFRLGRQIHRVPVAPVIAFVEEVSICSIVGTGTAQLAADYLIHTINYYKIILL